LGHVRRALVRRTSRPGGDGHGKAESMPVLPPPDPPEIQVKGRMSLWPDTYGERRRPQGRS